MSAFGNKWPEEPTEGYVDSLTDERLRGNYRSLLSSIDEVEILCDICGYYYATHEEECDGLTYDVCDEQRCLNAMRQCRAEDNEYEEEGQQCKH